MTNMLAKLVAFVKKKKRKKDVQDLQQMCWYEHKHFVLYANKDTCILKKIPQTHIHLLGMRKYPTVSSHTHTLLTVILHGKVNPPLERRDSSIRKLYVSIYKAKQVHLKGYSGGVFNLISIHCVFSVSQTRISFLTLWPVMRKNTRRPLTETHWKLKPKDSCFKSKSLTI